MKSNRIEIQYRDFSGDCTSNYNITFPKGMTVREFIEEQLKDTNEWGYFEVHTNVGVLTCEYAYGKLKTGAFPEDILESEIQSVSGRGGWSRSDFKFVV